ncbi:tautomerase family protein [Hoeflea sp.]|uniref:tautomerase family protein n=1 Tax=Hoeflea sp. TaxID=1940281 RepID=UPI003A8DAE6D
MPLIRISHAARYEAPVKEKILADVTAAYAAASGCDPAKVWVIVDEVEGSDWSTGGVSLASKVMGAAGD